MTAEPWAALGLSQVLRLALGAVFLLAAVGKLTAPRAWVESVREHHVRSRMLSPPVALAVVAAELFVAFTFLSGMLLRPALIVAGGCLLVFVVSVRRSLRRGRAAPCGCFGPRSERISERTLARLGLLLLGVVALAGVTASPGRTAPVWSGSPPELMSEVALALSLAVVTTWLVRLPSLWATPDPDTARR